MRGKKKESERERREGRKNKQNRREKVFLSKGIKSEKSELRGRYFPLALSSFFSSSFPSYFSPISMIEYQEKTKNESGERANGKKK